MNLGARRNAHNDIDEEEEEVLPFPSPTLNFFKLPPTTFFIAVGAVYFFAVIGVVMWINSKKKSQGKRRNRKTKGNGGMVKQDVAAGGRDKARPKQRSRVRTGGVEPSSFSQRQAPGTDHAWMRRIRHTPVE